MEKITQSSVSSNASTVIMDLSKNFSSAKNLSSSKAYSKNNSNFKDYIKNSNENPKNDKIKNEAKFDDKKQTIHDENKMGKMSVKKETQNVGDNKEEKVEFDNSQNSFKEKEKIVNKESENVEKEEVINDKKTDINEDLNLENIQNVLSSIINFSNQQIKLNEELQKLPDEIVQEIKIVLENLPQVSEELKAKILNVLENAEKDAKGDFLISEFFNSEDISQIKNIREYFGKLVENKKENLGNAVNTDNIKISDLDIGKELSSLKNDFTTQNTLKNNIQNEIQNMVFEDIKEENIAVNDIMNSNVKIFANNARIFAEVKNSAMNPQQIQNFSKVIEEMRIAFRDDKTTLNIKLEPETLGKLSIKIHSENGVINASFFVESDRAKQAVENQIQLLRQALTDQNINIQDINVQVGQNNEDLNYHKNIMEAVNFSKRDGIREISQDFNENLNPYLKDDLFNDLI